jgi:hypothetical protein
MKKSFSVALLLAGGLWLEASCTPSREFSNGGAAGALTSAGTAGMESGGEGGSTQGADAGESGMGGSTGMEGDCTEGEKLCDGACVAISDPAYGCDPTLCSPSRCPDAGTGALACEDGECVIAECGAGTKSCGGTCVSIADPAFGCGADSCDASSCPSLATGGTLACEAGECVIDSCEAGFKKCDGKCVSVSDPTYGCSANACDASSCPAVGSGTVVCESGACVLGECGAGTKECEGKCVPTDANNGCTDPARCTACAGNEACQGSPSSCQCVPSAKATACLGKCGSVPNGCGGMHACGSCTSPETCGGGGIDNVCGCTNTPKVTACAGKNCGSVSNGCGGTYSCGSCTSTNAPICVSNVCKQCGTVSDCPAGFSACSNNACVCRRPSNTNLLPNPGMDGSGQPWTPVSQYSSEDADGCADSGSIPVLDYPQGFGHCLAATAGATYYLSFRFKAADGGTGYCSVQFYSQPNCDIDASENSFEASVSSNGTWKQAVTTSAQASSNAVSMNVGCISALGFGYYDQLYLGRSNGTF